MQQSELGLLSAFWQAGVCQPPSKPRLQYQLSFEDPYGHYLGVKLSLQDVKAGQRFLLPVWIPGSYMVRDFAKHIVSVTAEAEGKAVSLTMLDKSSWQLEADYAQLSINLRVYAFDDSVRAAWFDERRAFINGTSCFLRVEGREDWPCELEVLAPSHAALNNWRLATGLAVLDAPEWGFGRFWAEDYAALIDHPLEAGCFELLAFTAEGCPHVVLLSGNQDALQLNQARLLADLQRICSQQIGLYEPDTKQAPFSRYLFLTYVTANAYGGLEHRNSTALVCAQNDLPTLADDEKPRPQYQQFLGLCSHEYFHSWNVKRITPAAFQQPNYQAENYSQQLWAFEGITSYYDDLSVLRAGCISSEDWLNTLGQTVTRVYRGAGRHGQSVADSSFTAWTRFYQQDANAANAIVSYYAKGALLALCIDLKCRLLSQGRLCLDDLMRGLWRAHGKTGVAVPEAGIEELLLDLLSQRAPEAVVEMQAFLQAAIYGTEDLPLAELLTQFGLGLRWRAAAAINDKGGSEAEAWRVWLGCSWKDEGRELLLQRVDNDSPAHRAGLSVNDRLVAINGFRVSADWIQQQCLAAAPGEVWQITLFRGNRLIEKTLTLEAAPKTTALIELMPEPSTEALARRQEWLQC